MPVVNMPDGAQVSFPDEMPAHQIRSLIQGKFPDAARQLAKPPEITAQQPSNKMIVEFEGQHHEFPNDFTDAEVRSALQSVPPVAQPKLAPVDHDPFAAQPKLVPVGHVPFAVSAPDPNVRALKIGLQGTGAGLAELASLPVDLPVGVGNVAVQGINKLTGANIPTMHPPSEAVKYFAAKGADAAGFGTIDQKDMSDNEKLAYKVNSFGSQAAASIPALVKLAGQRAAEIATGSGPKIFDNLLRPYMGENVGRTVVGDAAAAAGSGTAVSYADRYGFTDPVSQTGAALGGGVGGMTAVGLLEHLARRAANYAGKPFGANIDRTVNVDPDTTMPVTKDVSDAAALRVQNASAYDPAESAARIQGNTALLRALDPEVPLPSPAALAEDPGLATLQGVIDRQNQGPAMARNREFSSGVRDTIDRSTPDGAEPQHLVDAVRREADYRTAASNAVEDNVHFDANVAAGAGQRQIAAAETAQARAERGVRRTDEVRAAQGETLSQAAGNGVGASQRLDQAIVDRGYIPARAEKNRQFDQAPGRIEQLPADDVLGAVERVRAQNNALRPDNQVPENMLQRLEALSPNAEPAGTGTALGGDMADVRKYLSTAIERARSSGNFDMADSLQTLRRAINRTVETAPGYADANQNYQRFADTYRPGPGDEAAKFTRQIDRDPTRSQTPPSQTAGRFLSPGQPEKQAALVRMMGASQDRAGAQASAREFLLNDMVSRGVVDARTGVLRPDRLRAWQTQWGDLSNIVPGFHDDLTATIAQAQRGANMSERFADQAHRAGEAVATAQKGAKDTATRFADEVRTAQRASKATQDEIDKGALGLVLNADPDKAVAAVMSQTNRTGKLMAELIQTVGNDQQARNGLKAAVRDYLIDKATTGASEKLKPGDSRGPVSQAKLSGIFREHEKELAQVFDPAEMNTLRAGNKALELANVERLRTGSGSDITEKLQNVVDVFRDTPLGKGVEAFARWRYGMLRAGGAFATARRVLSGVTGGVDSDDVARLITRAAVDPDLMGLLLGRKIPISSPAWNQKLNRILAVGEGARDTDTIH